MTVAFVWYISFDSIRQKLLRSFEIFTPILFLSLVLGLFLFLPDLVWIDWLVRPGLNVDFSMPVAFLPHSE